MESERESLKPFRRAMSKEDQEALDRLFDRAKMYKCIPVLEDTWLSSDPW